MFGWLRRRKHAVEGLCEFRVGKEVGWLARHCASLGPTGFYVSGPFRCAQPPTQFPCTEYHVDVHCGHIVATLYLQFWGHRNDAMVFWGVWPTEFGARPNCHTGAIDGMSYAAEELVRGVANARAEHGAEFFTTKPEKAA